LHESIKIFIGPFPCRFYIGQRPTIMVADLEMIKHVMVKEFSSFIDREVSGIP